MNPVLEHQRIMPMPAGHNEREAWHVRQRQRAKLFPLADFERHFVRKKVVIRERRAVIKNRDVEILLQREWRNGLSNVAGAGNPEGTGRGDNFVVKPVGSR